MFKNYLKAARLRTLPLSVSGIIVGCGLANFGVLTKLSHIYVTYITFNLLAIFILAILTTIGFQVLSNFANDYGDGVKGTDANRIGEQRMVASGVISPQQMKKAMLITAIITLLLAIFLIYAAFGSENFYYSLFFFVLGLLAIVAAIKYTVGKSAYGYSGFGDLFVFIFFGIVSVVGSYFLYTKQLNLQLLLPASSIGLLSVAVLNLNNMRDIKEDIKANKNTLVVKMGSQNAKKYHYFLIIGALLCAVIFVQLNYHYIYQYLFLIAFIPLLLNLRTVSKNKQPRALDRELKKVALSTFLFAILFAFGNVL